MKSVFTTLLFSLLAFPMLMGQNTVEANASANWIAFMNVFNLDGGYEFGSAWGLADVKSSVDMGANTLILQPNFNTYANNPGDPYWIDPMTGEGAKNMFASTFVEPGPTFNGADLTFQSTVQSYTLDEAYDVKYFVKALDPDNNFADALGGAYIFDLPTSGTFSITVPGAELTTGLIIQYGFEVSGRNANPANEAALGSVVVGEFTSSVNDFNTLKAPVSIYPNPANGILSIQTDVQVQSFEITNLMGQQLIRGNATTNVDVSQLAAGTYFITIRAEEGNKVMKFMKN